MNLNNNQKIEYTTTIHFHDWKINCDGVPQIAVARDDHVYRLLVDGDMPMDLHWELLVDCSDHHNIISLEPMGNGLGVLLDREQLGISGFYYLRLRGSSMGQSRKTTETKIMVRSSLDHEKLWPKIPSEFTQLEERVYQAAGEVATHQEQVRKDAQEVAETKDNYNELRDHARRALEAAEGAETSEKKAADSEKHAADSAELAQQAAAQAGYMGFEVDENGNLVYQRTENVSVNFKMEEGNLLLL